jgi:hypothetical protein
MPMPLITEEVIESIRVQSVRDNGTTYCIDVFKEIEKENPQMHEAIMASVKLIYVNIGLDPLKPNDYVNILNILNLAVCVYQSIKQQIIVNDLEDSIV